MTHVTDLPLELIEYIIDLSKSSLSINLLISLHLTDLLERQDYLKSKFIEVTRNCGKVQYKLNGKLLKEYDMPAIRNPGETQGWYHDIHPRENDKPTIRHPGKTQGWSYRGKLYEGPIVR